MPKDQKRKRLTLQQKVEILDALDRKLKPKDLAEQYGCSLAAVYSFREEKEKIREALKSMNPEMKNAKIKMDDQMIELDKRVYGWYIAAKARNLNVTGTILCGKALKAAEFLGITDFKATTGWLDAFKRRRKIVFREPDASKRSRISEDEEPEFFSSERLNEGAAVPTWEDKILNPSYNLQEPIELIICSQENDSPYPNGESPSSAPEPSLEEAQRSLGTVIDYFNRNPHHAEIIGCNKQSLSQLKTYLEKMYHLSAP